MATIRLRVVFALVVFSALAVVAVAAGGAPASDPDLKAPTLLAPAPNLSTQAGKAVTFRIRTHARDMGLVLRVSRSSTRGKCGVIAGEVARAGFVRTGVPSVYEAKPAGAAISSSWLSTPGTYFWQAYRIAGRDGCVESGVRALRVAPKPPLALGEARLEGRSEVTRLITAVDGFAMTVGDSSKVTYTFKPACASGPCDTTLGFGVSGIFPGITTSVTVPLARTGAGYAGSGPATLSTCGSFGVKGTLEVQLEVSAAAWVGSVWRATGVVGHERYSSPEATGSGFGQKCAPASWEADLTGTLSGAGQLSVGVTSPSGAAPAGG